MGGSEKKRKRTAGSSSKEKKKSKRARSVTPEPPPAPLLPAAVTTELPSKDSVQNISPAAQDAFITTTGGFCERAVRCVHSGVRSLAPGDAVPVVDGAGSGVQKAAAVEDIVLADMARLRSVPLARQFTDITLWRRLRSANNRVISAVEGACDAVDGGAKNGGKGAGTKEQEARAPGEAGRVSFRKARMESLTERFAGELGKLHESEKMGSERVKFLLRCLEEGADIFAGLFEETKSRV